METARIILGHRSVAITEVYAELDQQKALALKRALHILHPAHRTKKAIP